jgi:hypothetical protein
MRALPHGPDSAGTLFDLSEGGCSIELENALVVEMGTQVQVEIIVRDLRLICSEAEFTSDSTNRMFVHGVKLRRTGTLRRRQSDTQAAIQFIDNGGPDEVHFYHRFRRLTSLTKVDGEAHKVNAAPALRA